MRINYKKIEHYYFFTWIICSVLYGIYVLPMCDGGIFNLIEIAIPISAFILPWFFPKKCRATILLSPIIGLFIILYFYSKIWSDKALKGPAIICRFYITQVVITGTKAKAQMHTEIYGYLIRGKDTIRTSIGGFEVETRRKKWIYVIYNFKCPQALLAYERVSSEIDNSKLQKFSFIEDKIIYSYHDYAIKQPNYVYYVTGFNVVYKATFDGEYLHFVDVCGNNQKVKYSVGTNEILPDTFLVYKNVNEEIDDRFIVCAKEINTPGNWSKISDYGYIFHYDIYRKEEIETQCPQIKNYVEKYKERNKQ